MRHFFCNALVNRTGALVPGAKQEVGDIDEAGVGDQEEVDDVEEASANEFAIAAAGGDDDVEEASANEFAIAAAGGDDNCSSTVLGDSGKQDGTESVRSAKGEVEEVGDMEEASANEFAIAAAGGDDTCSSTVLCASSEQEGNESVGGAKGEVAGVESANGADNAVPGDDAKAPKNKSV